MCVRVCVKGRAGLCIRIRMCASECEVGDPGSSRFLSIVGGFLRKERSALIVQVRHTSALLYTLTPECFGGCNAPHWNVRGVGHIVWAIWRGRHRVSIRVGVRNQSKSVTVLWRVPSWEKHTRKDEWKQELWNYSRHKNPTLREMYKHTTTFSLGIVHIFFTYTTDLGLVKKKCFWKNMILAWYLSDLLRCNVANVVSSVLLNLHSMMVLPVPEINSRSSFS